MKLKHHKDHALLQWIPRIILADWWITLGDACYGPDDSNLGEVKKYHLSLLAHEQVHSDRQHWWTKHHLLWLWVLLYLIFPVPVFFAWFRWKEERVAYLKDLEWGFTIDEVVDECWAHGWCWPKPLMRKWFENANLLHRPSDQGHSHK